MYSKKSDGNADAYVAEVSELPGWTVLPGRRFRRPRSAAKPCVVPATRVFGGVWPCENSSLAVASGLVHVRRPQTKQNRNHSTAMYKKTAARRWRARLGALTSVEGGGGSSSEAVVVAVV